jgi:photosystem II stability/assembly factor-like uncharacterized protein
MERRRHLAATLGLVVLVIIDAALVFAALRITGRSSVAEPVTDVTAAPTTSEPAPTPTETTTTPSGPASSSTGPATGPANVPGVPTTVVLSVVNGDVAWRATVGSCGTGGGAVDVTTDGGKTWRNRTSPFPVVTRISATDATKGFVVGADAACSMGVRTTTDAGGTWPGTAPLADTLARDAKDPTKVHAPGNLAVAPCEAAPVVDLARSSSTAAQVMCADGTIRSSTDDGRTWSETAKITSGRALDSRLVGSTVTAYVAWTKTGCEGVQVSKVVEGQVSDLGCAPTGDEGGPGKVALAAPTADTGWLVVGGSTWRSSDGLKTWAKA